MPEDEHLRRARQLPVGGGRRWAFDMRVQRRVRGRRDHMHPGRRMRVRLGVRTERAVRAQRDQLRIRVHVPGRLPEDVGPEQQVSAGAAIA